MEKAMKWNKPCQLPPGPKLVFVDIDGTLTPPGQNTPPASAVEAISRARQAGHKVFLCTGRNEGMLRPLLQWGFDGYVGCAGGLVNVGGEEIFQLPLAPEVAKQALELLRGQGVYVTVETREDAFVDPGLSDFLSSRSGGSSSELARWRAQIEAELGIKPMSMYDGGPLYKIIFMSPDMAALEPARSALGGELDFVTHGADGYGIVNGELVNKAFDKGRAIGRVCAHLGMGLEHTLGFGDSRNDVEMMEAVACGIAMGDGDAHLQSLAHGICPPVSEDGLAFAFEALGLM